MLVCLRSQPSCHASLKFAGYSNLLNGDILKMSNLKLSQPGVASSACGVSSAHLNYKKHPMIRSVYCFHVYYHVRRVLKRLQVPHETGFNVADNPYTESEFLKFVRIIGVPNDPMKYRDKTFIGLISAVFIGLMIILAWTQ